MPRCPIAAILLAIFATLIALPSPSRAMPPCPQPPPPSVGGRSMRIRALLSALIPSVYLELDARTVRTKQRQARLSAPDRTHPNPGEWQTEADRDGEWEIGVMWDPVRIVRRTRDAARLRDLSMRTDPDRLEMICPLRDGDGYDEETFERRLERAATAEERRALERLFD